MGDISEYVFIHISMLVLYYEDQNKMNHPDLFFFDEGDLEVLAELVGAAKADDATALKCCDRCKPCAW